MLRQEFALVKASLCHAAWVQWHRHQHIGGLRLGAHMLRQQFPKRPRHAAHPVIFQAVDRLAQCPIKYKRNRNLIKQRSVTIGRKR
jgi:hypothetical protein